MIKIYISVCLLLIITSVFAQAQVNKISKTLEAKMSNASETDEILVWIYFADKGTNTNYYFGNPQSVVREKSIKRRAKEFTNSAPLTIRDLPVNSDILCR